MATDTSRGAERLRRIDQVEAEYRQALCSGQPADPKVWAARYPELAPELAARLGLAGNDMETIANDSRALGPGSDDPGETLADPTSAHRVDPADMETLAQVLSPGPNPLATTVDARPRGPRPAEPAGVGASIQYFGDYELTKVLGKGGMGVVYKARQISLNRDVALKMIRDAAFASEADLQRFQNEAEAVATLDHPNIVPILEIGHHGDQRYFSMKLISGGSLEKRVPEYQTNPRAAATLLAKVADGIFHAHQRGILHRDLKPANILIDEKGEPHITDFGLAKKIEGDDGLTQSGAIMGTPAFMAPEQATGLRGAVTTASDVYGLGAILYTMLVGRAPFGGDSVLATLDQVRNKPPEPPTRINAEIPRDLEVICLKCLEKEPERRYRTAQDLADDLRRWLDGQPINARPVNPATRAWMWAKRNPVVSGMGAAISTLVVTLAVGSTVAAVQINEQKQAAETARDDARDRADAEQKAKLFAVEKAEEARQAQALADENSKLAETQAYLALTTLQTLVGKVERELAGVPGTQSIREGILKQALGDLDNVAAIAERSTSIEATRAAVYMQTGNLYRQLGQTAKAREQYQLCHEITTKRVEIKNHSDAARSNLAGSYLRLAEVGMEIDRDMSKALEYYLESLKLREAIEKDPRTDAQGQGKQDEKDVLFNLGEAYMRVGATYFRLGDPKRAMQYFRKAIRPHEELVRKFPDQPDYKQNLARTHLGIAETSFRLDDLDRANKEFAETVQTREQLAQLFDKNLFYKFELAGLLSMYGEFLVRTGKPDEAGPLLAKAATLFGELQTLDEKNVLYQRELGLTLYRQGACASRAGDEAGAADFFQRSREVRDRLANLDGADNVRRRIELMLVLPHSGDVDEATPLAEEFLADEKSDAELLVEVARAYAQCAAVVAKSDPERAARYRGKAVDALRKSVAKGYKDPVYLDHEVDFDPLRDDEAFNGLLALLGKDRAARPAPADGGDANANDTR